MIKNYKVSVSRIGYGEAEFAVQASSKKSAQNKAMQMAYDHEYSEYDSTYEIESIEEEKI